ncbi:MAG: hypothetical protein HIU82_02830 [Proteobacteria bacterium]|nr:hypothetical protein [Pseudomonadota bacterium]
MSWLGLAPAAWTIVLVALATYAALLSAWLMALPTVRGAAMQEALLLLTAAAAATTEADRKLHEDALANLRARLIRRAPRDRRAIRTGWWLLVASLAAFSAAVVLQARTDPAFRAAPAAAR